MTPPRWFTARRLSVLAAAGVAIAVVAYLAAPLFLMPAVEEAVPAGFALVAKAGAWVGADDFHFASGLAKLLTDGRGNYVLRLENFSVRNGPDIEFFLSADADYNADDVRLGQVTATVGSYSVPIPRGTDIEAIHYAIIWCVPFSVLFATARLA